MPPLGEDKASYAPATHEKYFLPIIVQQRQGSAVVMQIDAITLAAVADDWRTLLVGARIDTIIQPTEYAVAMQCYAPGREGEGGHNRWLYLSAHPQLARAHITALKPTKIANEPPAFVMLL